MAAKTKHEHASLQIMLILIVLATGFLFHQMAGYKMVVLHLFTLPVVLSAFFLGRYSAGLLALFCVACASAVAAVDLTGFAAYSSPVIIGLAVTVWGCVLGLTALLVGTLSDDRRAKMNELHQSYVAIVEVLSRYLQGAHPRLKDRSIRVAEISQQVASEMNLSIKEIEDVRVAALLYDIGKIEITTKLINKAVNALQATADELTQETFQGIDLIYSLSAVLSSETLRLLDADTAVDGRGTSQDDQDPPGAPVGCKIIRTVRAFDNLIEGSFGEPIISPQQAIAELRDDSAAGYDRQILNALERSVSAELDTSGAALQNA